MTAEWQLINVISLVWDTWKNCKPRLQFFHVSHNKGNYINPMSFRCHSAVIPLSFRCHSAVCICSVDKNSPSEKSWPHCVWLGDRPGQQQHWRRKIEFLDRAYRQGQLFSCHNICPEPTILNWRGVAITTITSCWNHYLQSSLNLLP